VSARPLLREAGVDDERIIRDLLRAAYPDNPKVDPAIMRWQYWDNPFGRTRAWIWELEGQAIAHWAAVPVPLVLDGQPVVGVKTADAATHPEHRRQGLFAELAAAYMTELGRSNVPAVLTHPNPDSTPGVAASGAQLVARVPAFVRALDDGWLAQRLHLPLPLARPLVSAARRVAFRPSGNVGPDAIAVPSPPRDLDALWQATGGSYGVRRDSAWWEWRYVQRPAGEYRFAEVRRHGELVGAAALQVREAFGGRFGYVMEFMAADVEAAQQLTAVIEGMARAQAAVGLVLIATPRSSAGVLAQRAGFRRLPQRLEPNPLRFLVAAPAGSSAALAAQDWSIAWGDLDHV